MTNDEAARPGAGEQGDSVPPAHDERPRPQYGEYAPPGWSWTPPGDEARTDASADAALQSAPVAASGSPAAGAAAPHAHPIDRLWTVTLLVFGVFGALYNSLALFQLPTSALESAELSASMLGVDGPTDFTPGPAVPVFIFVGIALQLALWLGAVLWSRARLRAGRLAWWIPLLAGVAAFIVVLVVGMLVFSSDPAFLQSLTPAES